MSATAIAVAVAIETLAIWTARVSGGAGLVWLDIARLALSIGTEVHNRIPHRLARYGAAGMGGWMLRASQSVVELNARHQGRREPSTSRTSENPIAKLRSRAARSH